MNGGSVEFGGASGFSINDLKELKFIKSNVKGISLLNYIVTVLERSNIDIADFQAEVQKLQTASRLNLSDINEKLKNAQMTLAGRSRDPFVRASSRRVFDVMRKVNEIQKEYSLIARAFGVKETLLQPSSLLPILLDFSLDLSRALKEARFQGFLIGNNAKVSVPAAAPKPKPAAPAAANQPMKQRGFINTMVDALKTSNEKNGDEESEFAKAFAKVRKNI